MEKVYLLLRNGHQSGPFTIGELLQQQLKSSDMLWIEGKSNAWSYVSELEFNFSNSEKTPAPASSPSVSHPAEDEIERKAEALRQRALSYVPTQNRENMRIPRTYPVNSLKKEDEEVQIIYHRRDKKSVVQEVVMSAAIIAIFAAVIYGSRSYFLNSEPETTVANKIVSTDQHAAIANDVNKDNTQIKPVDTSLEAPLILNDSLKIPYDSLSLLSEEKPRVAVARKPVKKSVQIKEIKAEPIAVKEDDIIAPPVPQVEDIAKKEIVTPAAETAAPVEKKKTVGQALKGLFKKKKKDDGKMPEPVTESSGQ